MNDVNEHRLDGKLCATSNGKPIIWNGHLCRGANLTSPDNNNFCLWTLCGKHDVPANSSQEGHVDDVTCISCLEIHDEESA